MATLTPNHTPSLAPRVVTRKSKLGLTRLAAKPSNSILPKDVDESKRSNHTKEIQNENSNPTLSLAQAPPSAFGRDKAHLKGPVPELKRKGSRLGGSASRLGGLGNLVRRASRNLRDVTNTNSATSPTEAAKFVDVGVEDVQAVEGDMSIEVHAQTPVHAHIRPRTEVERAALEGRDPDIGEIMVVTRHRARPAIDLEWAQAQQEEGIATDGEGRIGRSKSGWWSNNKGKKSDGIPKQDGEFACSLPRNVALQHAPIPTSKLEKAAPTSQENKGSLVIRAIRSVRSLAHVSAPSQETATSDLNTQATSAKPHSKPLPDRPQASKGGSRKPSLAARRPGESTSSWEVGALSSPERDGSPSVLVPSLDRRRLVNRRVASSITSSDRRSSGNTLSTTRDDKATVRPEQARRSSVPIGKASEESPTILSTPPVSRQPVVNKRHSILSVISTDEMSGVESSTSVEKQNRRSSTGSSIRWDGDAMAQLAKKVREERKQLRAQRERERAQMGGATVHVREPKRDKTLARRRTPLSEIFDLSSCVEDSPAAADPAPSASIDPIMAATEALLGMTPSRSIESLPPARPRNKRVSTQPRPVGIVAVDGDQNDAAICVLNAANAELQNLVGTMDLSSPDVTPAITSTVPASNGRQSHLSSQSLAPVTIARRASQPAQSISTEDSRNGPRETSSISPLRRASGSVITKQVAVWPPVAPTQNPTSSSQSDPIFLILPQVRQRTRTSSSTSSVPPSAFNRKPSLTSGGNGIEVVPSLTLKTLRATRGHVLQKAKFYGDLDREATAAMEARNRRLSCQDESSPTYPTPPVRSRPVSFSGVDAAKERDGLMPPVDVVTDIPEELRNILVQRSTFIRAAPAPSVAEDEKCDSDASVAAIVASPTKVSLSTGGECTIESTQEFVYNGVDADSKQHAKAAPSLALSSEHSFVQEFSSYDEVSKSESTPLKEIKPEQPPVPSSNVFEEHPPAPVRSTHKSEESVASMESLASYCMISKRPTVQPILPLVIHGRQPSVESAGLSVDDTFSFASKPFPGISQPLTGVIRVGHRRTRSVTSISSGPSRRIMNRGSTSSRDSRTLLSTLGRPDVGDKMFSSNLPGIAASPISSDQSIDFTASEPTSPVSPGAGFTSSESLFEHPRHRGLSSSTTVASVFGLNAGEPASKGNLFGAERPMSIISNFSEASPRSDNGSQITLECFDGERVSSKVLDQLSPCDQNKRKRVVAKRNAIPSFDPPTKDNGLSSKTVIDLNVIDKLLAEEIATASVDRPRSRSLGHRRGKSTLARPLTIAVESIREEDIPALYHSPSRSRGSSSTSGAGSTQTGHNDASVAIAEAEPETGMVLRRYYTLQREAQEEIEQSRQLWEDTPFSMDEISDFQPPKEADEMKDFLDDSRKYYVELPTELRARRRARAAPYCVPSSPTQQETPESPVDNVFKDLSSWDHRRVRKVSEGKIRTRKFSEEKVRTRKISEEKVRARKLSEKKTKKVAPPPVPSLPLRTFSPFVDSVNAPRLQSTEEGLKVEPASLNSTVNSLGRAAKAAGKTVVKQESSQNPSSKENVLRSKHSVEGMLESPTGSLRISRPRPRRRGTTTSPPSTIRL